MRLFIAIDVPAEIKKDIAQSCWYARDALSFTRFSPEENLHITMAFLGEHDESSLGTVKDIVSRVAARHQSFAVRFLPPAIAPSPEDPRLLLLSPDTAAEPALVACASDVRTELTRAGIAFDPKPFRAHITLAHFDEHWRARRETASAQEQTKITQTILEALPEKEWTISCESLVLFSSVHGSDGSSYTALCSQRFSGGH